VISLGTPIGGEAPLSPVLDRRARFAAALIIIGAVGGILLLGYWKDAKAGLQKLRRRIGG